MDSDDSMAQPCSPAAYRPRGRGASRRRRCTDHRQAYQGEGPAGSRPASLPLPRTLVPPGPSLDWKGGAWRSWRSLRSKLQRAPHTRHPAPCPAQPCPSHRQSRQPVPAPSHQTRPGPSTLRLEARGSGGPRGKRDLALEGCLRLGAQGQRTSRPSPGLRSGLPRSGQPTACGGRA